VGRQTCLDWHEPPANAAQLSPGLWVASALWAGSSNAQTYGEPEVSTKQRFAGKVAVVTGAGGDIGRGIALHLASEGAAVVVANMSEARAVETVAQITAESGRAVASIGDIGNPADVEQAVALAENEFGGLDVLVNNAGISPVGTLLDTDMDLWERTLRTNLTGVFLGCKYGILAMRRRGGGAIVNIAGTLGLYAMPRKAAYCAAKAGVVNLTRQTAIDYGPEGIRINCVCPGYIETRLNVALSQEDKDLFLTKLPLRRGGVVEDVAAATAFLASDEARYITGAVVTIDGGQAAGLHD
jgi:NAD(P)-dependent dehydrogenase (short-subunit alcohol dehydrogenase family)